MVGALDPLAVGHRDSIARMQAGLLEWGPGHRPNLGRAVPGPNFKALTRREQIADRPLPLAGIDERAARRAFSDPIRGHETTLFVSVAGREKFQMFGIAAAGKRAIVGKPAGEFIARLVADRGFNVFECQPVEHGFDHAVPAVPRV